jgi:hypothetical protein
VRERWLSKRAVSLHVAVLVFVPGCAVAAWWQINRAADGNQLSYLYSVMWPAFGVLGLVFWWVLIHTDYDTVGLKGLRRQEEQQRMDAAPAGADGGGASPVSAGLDAEAPVPSAEEEPELAAYNARLAALAEKGPKTWRRRETVVVRRAP